MGINVPARETDPTNVYYPGEGANAAASIAAGTYGGTGILDTTLPHGTGVLGDTVKRNSLYDLMSNNLDIRGDVFTANVKLVGLRQINGKWTQVASRNYSVVYDRSAVQNPGDMPKILMFVEW